MHSAVFQHDSSITGSITSFKDCLSESEFEMDLDDMESTVLYLNDEDEKHLRSLPELDREAIFMDFYDQLKAVVDPEQSNETGKPS